MPNAKHEHRTKVGSKLCLDAHVTMRTVLLLMLLAAAGTFLQQVYGDIYMFGRHVDDQRVSDADVRLDQAKLEAKLARDESNRLMEMIALEDKISLLSKNRAGVDGEGKTVETPLVPDLKYAVGAVVQIICLEKSDKDTVYTGSGTIVDHKGLVLTNRHLLLNDDGSLIRYCGVGFTQDIKVPPLIEYVAETVAVREEVDLAILQIAENLDGKDLPAEFPIMPIRSGLTAARRLEIGDQVYIVGYPGIGAETFTFTQGVVSGRVGKDMIKTSALIDSGTSGGAAMNTLGDFIGVPTAAARGDIGGSLGYLIGAEAVDQFMKDFYAGELNSSVSFDDEG